MAAPVADVRNELHELIDAIPNTEVLLAVRTILAAQWRSQMPTVVLSAEAEEAVREGLQQLDAGQGISHEQVMAEARAKYGHA
jgi:predicted transcriptional regulator